MTMQVPGGPIRGAATRLETGRACPYCRFALKEGDAMVQCGACAAAHHADCWADNGNGCAMVACPGGPSDATRAEQAPTAVTPPAAPQQQWAPPPPAGVAPTAAAPPPPPGGAAPPPSPPMWQPPPASPGGRTGPWVLAAAVVLALAVAGAAVAVVTTQQDGEQISSQNAAATQTVTQDEEPPADDASGDFDTDTPSEPEPVDPVPSNGVLPELTDAEMEDEIQTMLREWHEALVNGDYRTAFNMLTQRKRDKALREDGYDGWVVGQKTLGDHIDPSGLTATIVDKNEETGVVTVEVDGMAYSNPKSDCTTWGGITWVRWQDEEWQYDPGYSTTPQRTREWKPRLSELMGIGC